MAQVGGTHRTTESTSTLTSVVGKTVSSPPVVVRQQHCKPLRLLVPLAQLTRCSNVTC
jgi:hypothetical protein